MSRRLSFQVMVAFVALLALPACTQTSPSGGEAQMAIGGAQTGVAGIVAHTESAQRNVEQAVPHADDVGKVSLAAAGQEHKAVLVEASKTSASLTEAGTKVRELDDQLADSQTRYAQLEARWYVRWGRWLTRAFWIVVISWLVLGVGAIALGIGNPLGWASSLGKEIVRLLPAMNVFAWIRDWIAAKRSALSTQAAAGG